ncbi:MAG: hypothetical protein HYR85_20685 [Planctomycetes bacterium]|nr:hypothetical protein [Planctomycetota bacterium]MBI3846134.1 hypothetical protein [Planctomycetota bacterium]
MSIERTELVYHNFATPSEFAEVDEGARAGLFRRVEVDFLLTDESVTIARSTVGVDEFLGFLRDRRLKPFIHAVDQSVYTPRSLALLRARLEESGIAIPDTIVGSTNIPGLQATKHEIPGIENQSRHPVLGIDYLHQFGPDLLRRLEGADPARLGKADAIRRLFDFEIPPDRERDYERLHLITSYDPIDKVSGDVRLTPGAYLAGIRRIFAFPWMRLVITNGLGRREYRDVLREVVTP